MRWVGLSIGLAVGGLFSFAQQTRGAHFLSHDLWSAIICWYVVLLLYVAVLRGRETQTSAFSTIAEHVSTQSTVLQ